MIHEIEFGIGSRHITECLIGEKIIPYDACSTSGTLEEAKGFYKNFEYIGSSKFMYLNGHLNTWDHDVHFFKNVNPMKAEEAESVKSYRRHMSTNIEGLLRNLKGKKITFLDDDDGNTLSDKDARILITELQAKGHKLIPCGDCEGFDPFGKGCPGHEILK